MSDVEVRVEAQGDGYVAAVTVRARATTRHTVRVSPDELRRYGGGEPGPTRRPRAERSETSGEERGTPGSPERVGDLVRRSFEFLLAREPNTSILRDFDLGVIERYFPEYPRAIGGG